MNDPPTDIFDDLNDYEKALVPLAIVYLVVYFAYAITVDSYRKHTTTGRATIGGATVVVWATASAFMYYIRAPNVVTVRPQLAEVGFQTALFSGRFQEWLFYTEPLAGVAYQLIVSAVVGIALLIMFAPEGVDE